MITLEMRKEANKLLNTLAALDMLDIPSPDIASAFFTDEKLWGMADFDNGGDPDPARLIKTLKDLESHAFVYSERSFLDIVVCLLYLLLCLFAK